MSETPEQKEAFKKLDAMVDEIEEKELDEVELGRATGGRFGLGLGWNPFRFASLFAMRRRLSPPPGKDDAKS